MILLVGLGNPGPKYERNRHNIGFMAVDRIAWQWDFSSPRKRFQGITQDGSLDTKNGAVKTLLLKPTTYMNESGRAVSEAMRFYKLGLEQVIVFHDELDLAPGKVRVKTGGGHAGNNGLRSIMAHIGAGFRRVRMGIGHPGHKDAVHSYVLQDFRKSEQAWVDPLIEAMAKATPLLVGGDDASFMNKVHLDTQPKQTNKTTKKADKAPKDQE